MKEVKTRGTLMKANNIITEKEENKEQERNSYATRASKQETDDC